MIISVASGKGGTGKTTVSTNLAYCLGENVQLLDCDVEEPNAYLFLNPTLKKKETVYALVPEVDLEKCTLCGKCVHICRYRAITMLADTMLTFPQMCHSCGGCLAVCPDNAIVEVKREYGIMEHGHRGSIGFRHGKLHVGHAMSPPLIKKVRSFVEADKINIIDAPPGTTCPVIAAMKGADFVLLVTEPTPFGLHDLKLAAEAVKLLRIPCGLVINRADIGNNEVRQYAKQVNLPVLLEIPFDRKIAEAYSRGLLISEVMPKWKKHFLHLYQQIEKIADKGVSAP